MKSQETYEVFARQWRKEPLQHVGTVVAPNGDLAAAFARTIYNEEAWVEMQVAARKNFIPAIEIREEGK